MPAWWLSQYGLWNGISVSLFCVTLYWIDVSSARNTSSLGLDARIGCGLVPSARASDDDCAAHAPSASAMTANRRADIRSLMPTVRADGFEGYALRSRGIAVGYTRRARFA